MQDLADDANVGDRGPGLDELEYAEYRSGTQDVKKEDVKPLPKSALAKDGRYPGPDGSKPAHD